MRIVLNKLKKMDYNLKNPEELKKSHNENIDFSHDIRDQLGIKERTDESETPKYRNKAKSGGRQSNLISFVNNKKLEKVNKMIGNMSRPLISLSNRLPMKFGLRRHLKKAGIPFQIINSDNHIIISNRVVIQLYNPSMISKKLLDQLINFHNKMSQKYQLIIQIFDFIDYEGRIEGEKHLLKRKIQDFGNKYDIRLISIENSEELCLIVKDIYETQSKGLK